MKARIRWQCDAVGRMYCGDHIDPSRGGDISTTDAAQMLREADATGSTDAYVIVVTRELNTCDRCQRHVTDWPVEGAA